MNVNANFNSKTSTDKSDISERGTTATIDFVEDIYSKNEALIQARVKVHCENEHLVLPLAISKKDDFFLLVTSMIASKGKELPALKEIVITKGSINFDFFFNGFHGFRDISQIIDDILDIGRDICQACVNYVNALLYGDIITSHTISTTASAVTASGAIGAGIALGAPTVVVAAVAIGVYRFIKKLFE